MITTINNKHNKLNVPNKREQNQTCLDSAEREGLSPKGNVPTLRFPEFQGEWEKHELGDICETITDFVAAGSFASLRENVKYYQEDNYAQLVRTVDLKKDFTNNDFVYVDELAYDFLWRVQLKEPNIILPNIGANIGEKYYVSPEDLPKEKNVLGPNAILLRSKCNDTHFVYFRLSTSSYDNEMKKLVGASGQPKFNKTDLKKVRLFMPSLKEQKKISHFLGLLEERIATQNKIIDKLQSLIKGISNRIFASIQGIEYRMGDIVTITNGNSNVQDAVTQSKDGLYPFFDRSEDIKYLPTFLFDKEAIIYPGEGTEFMPRYFKGKFALHQRCYAIFDFNEIINARFLYFYLKTRNSYFVKNAVGSTVPSLRLDTFQMLKVIIPPTKTQHSVSSCLSSMEQKCNVEKKILYKLLNQKQYLLRQMFI